MVKLIPDNEQVTIQDLKNFQMPKGFWFSKKVKDAKEKYTRMVEVWRIGEDLVHCTMCMQTIQKKKAYVDEVTGDGLFCKICGDEIDYRNERKSNDA